jgi:hypothetical protein
MSEATEVQGISDKLEARGVRMARDEVVTVLRDSAFTLPGSIIVLLMDYVQKQNEILKLVPANWLMSHGELAAAGII